MLSKRGTALLARCLRNQDTPCTLVRCLYSPNTVLPTEKDINSPIYKTLNPQLLRYKTQNYDEDYRHSVEDPADYWATQAEKIDWFDKWTTTLDESNPPYHKWFVGGKTNICWNALDRHVKAGYGATVAMIYDSPVTLHKEIITYHNFLEKVKRAAGFLREAGVKKGDRVLIYMPMIPECAVTMLAATRLGAMHVVVFGGFAANELAVRIKHAAPTAIVTASAGIEPSRIVEYKPILDEAIRISGHNPNRVFIYDRKHISVDVRLEPGRDVTWEAADQSAKPVEECEPVDANDPCYLLHTSGTTGTPKAVVRPTGGYSVVLPWSMRAIYGLKPGETWWAATDMGWVVGHSYIVYGPMLAGVTSVLFDGKPVGTPDQSTFFRMIDEHRISSMFVAPTALRAIRQADSEGEVASHFPMRYMRHVHSAGEHLDLESRMWAEKAFRVPVLDHWWQTESGWAICAQCVGYPDVSLTPPQGASGKPVPGWNCSVIDPETKKDADADKLGRIVVKLPLPPGMASTLWQNDERFESSYFNEFPGYYDTADAGIHTKDGYVKVMARVDDVINVAGHRLSTGALEEAVLRHHDIADCAVIGVDDKLKGTIPVAVCVHNDSFKGARDKLADEIVQIVRKHVGAVAALKKVLIVPKLPKTRSGKIARNTMAAMAVGKPFKIPVTIDDPTVYPVIKATMERHGLGKPPK